MYDKLHAAMKRHNIKGYSLAKLADIDSSSFYSALNGSRPFYPNWRKRIAEALGVPECELFDESEASSNDK